MNKKYVFEKEQNDPLQYYWFENGFNQTEIDRITKGVGSLEFERATVVGGDRVSDHRRSNVKWIGQGEEWDWLYKKLIGMIKEANDQLWKFRLESLEEAIQYTEYDGSEKGHYDCHQDIGEGILSLRKISVTVQLSDPSEYEGGEFHIMHSITGYNNIPKGLGNVTVFPSYMMHRVTPVTSGLRKVLVLWAGGSHYR